MTTDSITPRQKSYLRELVVNRIGLPPDGGPVTDEDVLEALNDHFHTSHASLDGLTSYEAHGLIDSLLRLPTRH